MLDPLELLRLAGVLKYEFKLLLPFSIAFCEFDDGVLCCWTNFLRSEFLSDELDECLVVDGDCVDDAFNPIFRTVLIDAELLSDDRELLRLVREPLRSTSLLDELAPVSALRRNEFVLFGMMLDRECGGTVVEAARNDRLRSKLCRFRSINDLTTDFVFG